MSRVTPGMSQFAERLISYEATRRLSGTEVPAAFLVCEKLRPHLATLMGSAGFRSLLSRALALTNAQGVWLAAVHVEHDGSLNGYDKTAQPVDPAALGDGGIVLVTQLLGLLTAFIGENLTVRLLHDVWPQVSLTDLQSANGGKK